MNRLRIKTKRDWCITFIFTILIVYGITTGFSFKLQSWLLNFGNPKLTNMNQPKSYGNLMITALTMTVIIEILLFLYHKSVKIKLITIVAGIACTGFIFMGYLMNCNLIVSVIKNSESIRMHIGGWGREVNVTMDEGQKEKLISYCEKLKPVSKMEEKKLEKSFYSSKTDITVESILIWTTYPKKYGHNYDMMVCVYNDMIFIRKGYDNHQREIVTFFKDNGLIDLIEEVVSE